MSENLGLGVMIKMLGGNQETAEVFRSCIGKTISSLSLESDVLKFTFSDGWKMDMWDGGQSCCEHRYMVTADNLQEFVGAKLLGGEKKEAPSVPDEYGNHEVQFLDIQTDKGVFQMANHNEHNGYYGGFWIEARAITPSP